MPASKYKPITLRPLTGIFDNRSNIDETPAGAFRWKQNFAINNDGKLARAKGWRRHGDLVCPGNADWHDQGVDDEDREPLTLLFPSTANNGTRRLFGATKTRIILLDEAGADWTTLGDATDFPLAAADTGSLTQVRFMAAELQNIVYFTNNLDPPHYVNLADIGSGAVDMLNTGTPPPLVDAGENDAGVAVNMTAARVVISWNDILIWMNTVEGGVRRPNRIRWSDLKNGLQYDQTDPAVIADFQDLDYGHVILNAIPQGNALYVYTDRSIWRCTFTIGTGVREITPGSPEVVSEAVLDALRVYYEPENQAKCLAYPNTLVSDGDTAWYGGRDGIYAYRPGYTAKPELREWLHRSTSIIFNGNRTIARRSTSSAIDTAACNSPIAEYHQDNNELHFSWPEYDPLAVVVPPDPATVDCETYERTPPTVGSGTNRHTLVANLKYETADYRDYGSTAMANFISDIELSGGCQQAAKLLSANGEDFCVKELNYGYAREMFSLTNVEQLSTGYFSILRGLFPFNQYDSEKEVAKFLAGLVPEDPLDTAVLRLRIGTSDVALDPNGANGRCGVLFHQLSNQPIRCRHTRSAAQYAVDNIRPDDPIQWIFFYKGMFLYYELTVAASSNAAPTTGGLTLSRFEVSARVI